MKPASWSALAAILLLTAPSATAQAPEQQQLPPPTRTVNLSVEQRHVIKEFLKDATAAKAPSVRVAVGDRIPDQVDLHDLPAQLQEKVPQIKSHKFFVTDNKVVLVDPKDRKAAEIIE